jgi:hypothetical protein
VLERNEEDPRCPNPLGDDAKEIDDDRGDSPPLELRRHQTHGLVADRSDGHEQGRIDRVYFEQPRRLGHDIALKSAGSGDRVHEGQVAAVQAAYATTIHELPQAVDGERQVRVAAKPW